MGTLYVDADAWDALDPDDRAVALAEGGVPVTLGQPAVAWGSFVKGVFVREDPPAPTPIVDDAVVVPDPAWSDEPHETLPETT